MADSKLDSALVTRASMFIKLNGEKTRARELAWEEFYRRYGPIIAGYARKLGAKSSQVDDVVQDVMRGFYSISPTFIYDPDRGRFRGYLKECTHNAIKKYRRKFPNHFNLDGVDPDQLIDQEKIWIDIWEHEVLREALKKLREETDDHKYGIFEGYAILGREAEDVAKDFGVTVDVVYQTKTRMCKELRNSRQQAAEVYG